MGVIVRGVSSEPPAVVLAAGEVAPDFALPALIGGVKRRFHLADRVTQTHVVLAFYPLNWESVSARQLVEYQAARGELRRHNCEIVCISVDSIMNTTVWEREIGPFDFALCSDFWPHGQVSRAYGVFRADGVHAGTSQRAVFVIKQGGRIAFSKVYESRDLAPLAETLGVLRGL
jgi:peroxiredoxin